MATITRTFGTTLTLTYIPVLGINPIVEVLHLRDIFFDADERLAIYLDTAQAVIDIGSFNIAKIPNLDGDESTIEEALALSKAESESNKIGLRILGRKNNAGSWNEIADFILLNYGRKDYLDLRTKTGFPSRLLEKNDALAVQLIDYGDGLLWDLDLITVNFALSIEIEKKNNLDAIEARMAALELALEGRLINLPANSLLGKGASMGTVEAIDRATFKAADADLLDGIDSSRVVFGDDFSKSLGGSVATTNSIFTTSGFIDTYGTQSIFPAGVSHINGFQARHRSLSNFWGMQAGCQHNIPNEFYFRTVTAGNFNPWNRIWNSGNLPIQYPVTGYGSMAIPGANAGYAGIQFTSAADNAVLMFNTNTRHHGVFSSSAAGGWHWLYNNGNFSIYSSNAITEGSFIGLYKGLNSLPGYPDSRYPTICTDSTHLYFSVDGIYSAHMTANGVLASVSDRDKKENLQRTDDVKILELLLQIPTYTYNFKKSDTRIRNLSCMAQDFYAAFGLGGDIEVDQDESPTCPSKMLAPSDAIGVCMAAIKGLYKLINK